MSRMIQVKTTEEFDDWFANLKDRQTAIRIQVRIDRAERGNLGDVKPVAAGVSEMRFKFDPGYRVYFVQRGAKLVILLGGGTKASQVADIKAALHLASEL